MNVKFDNDRKKVTKTYPHQNMGYQPPPMPYHYPPMMPYPPYMPPHMVPHQQSFTSDQGDKKVGEKPCNILVRELWIGGIPEHFDKAYMGQLMGYYGIVEDIEIFPRFAFVKYKQVVQATTAYERAQEIFQRLGSPQGFRITFSDPSRRAYVVSNHYEFERQATHIPIIFIGFPPVTSATVEIEVIKPVVEKIAPVKAVYMRKNINTQNRSYFLFSVENIKDAIKIKQELNRRKDLLGDKRAEVTILID